ncbi:zinc finger protein [Cinnamomum micranthum f. kanehirae]|uniref:Zinc finger protein n=1 Tax=Cinnamomum micranthum f. kanehirae TaxID=337451 RepID=A0A3S3P6H6_9MAGN|nr:zinc finger protein [Cinnamomum micranthum f. kanehirae]
MTQPKMMGRGSDGGCGTQEKPCPISRVSTRTLTPQTQTLDLYAQARKALCERSPFDSEEAAARVSTLPFGLAAFLSKSSDRRRKHKKSVHSESAAKAPRAARSVWADTEEYFRYIVLADVESLGAKSDLGSSSGSGSCFSVPKLPVGVDGDVGLAEVRVSDNVDVVEDVGLELVSVAEELENEGQQIEIEAAGVENSNSGAASEASPQKELENSDSGSIDLHWLFGSKHKLLLTSERPSKKRKLLGGEAGLDRLAAVGPSEGGNSVVCHACCSGDCSEQANRFLFCDSCGVCVHQRCYGVQDVPMEKWLCAHCRQRDCLKDDSKGKLAETEVVERPCLLCPKEGGALKPVDRDAGKSGNSGAVKFAHLFCSLWMPEVYVENMEMMEPIMNIGGIKDTRRRLVCFLCKVKYGVCIRCSHGTCRTSFHPMCAREAKLRMEIWGKVGCDNVELRAFCSKHSGSQDTSIGQQPENMTSVTAGSNSPVSKLLPVTVPMNRSHKIKLGRKNRDNSVVDAKSTVDNCNEQSKNETQLDADTSAMRTNSLISECADSKLIINMEENKVTERTINDANPTDSFNLVLILKKLINQGKASVNDVASEVGIPPKSLGETLVDEHAPFPPEWRIKLIEWLRNYNVSGMPFGSKVEHSDAPSAVNVVGLGPVSTDVPVTSSPPRRRVKGKIRILKGNKIVCTPEEPCDPQNGNPMLINEISENLPPLNEDMKKESIGKESSFCNNSHPSKESVTTEKVIVASLHRSLYIFIIKDLFELVSQYEADVLNSSVKSSGELQDCAAPGAPDLSNGESIYSSYIHPFINKRLTQMQNYLFVKQKNRSPECDGQREKGMFTMEATCSANSCYNHQAWHSSDTNGTLTDGKGEQFVQARKMGILEFSPEDEVEGELLYFQNRLLDNAVASKHRCEDLIFRVVTNLPHELDELRKQRWDAVFINQYLREVREAKKRGRKERRHREAQAVLAAATAAAAASSRISSLRKDAHDETAATIHEGPVKVNTVCGRAGLHAQSLPRVKETLSRSAVPNDSSGQTDLLQFSSDSSQEHPQICDICRRSETILNQILVCCNCKVSVHLGCYNSHTDSVGPWYCELCQELGQDRSSVAECGLCGGTTGAFRKSTDGQWVHAFCAEWLLESTYRRGQPNPVEGMEGVSKEKDRLVCCVCHCKHGVCMKCNYVGCQMTFNPNCAKNAGLFMNVKSVGGKLQHKAYCENHSTGQREKVVIIYLCRDETEQFGAEELRRLKQIRVELEKVRLLCERIIKREKLKRELVLCSHDILASRRDSVAFSVLVRSSFLPPDVSSESVTTSLKGHTDDNKSCSETMQRSDDITEDSTVSGTCRLTLPMHMGIDGKPDDSSTSKRPCTRKPTYRLHLSGKQLPHRPAPIASQNIANNRDKRSKSKKYTETFQKEVVMTSDQASVQNQRLPKGYVYVPICSLPKEKPASCDAGSHESQEPDG